MKKVFSQIESICMIIFVVLAFFPWIGMFNRSGVDIAKSVLENITSLASVEAYAITATLLFSVLSLLLALMQKPLRILSTLAFAGPIVAFIAGMIDTNGSYFGSMELAYIIVLVISIVMLLQQFGIIKLRFIK